jgi:hypothetical protein
MGVTENLNITEVEQNQNNRYITINNALIALAAATNAKLPKAVSGSGPVNLNSTECTRYVYYEATGGTGNFDFVFLGEIGANDADRMFVFKNSTTYVATVKSDDTGSTVTVPAGASALIHQSHDDMVKLCEFDGQTVSPYDIGLFLPGQPDDGIECFKFVATRNIDFADDFAGSRGHCSTNPTSTAAFDVILNGSTIGSISISTGGAFTFSTSGGAVAMSPGDRLTLTSPSPQDATLAGVGIVFLGTRDR